MEEQRETIMEEREGLMVVSSGSYPHLIRRPARFLKPCFLSLGIPAFDLPVSAFRSNRENLRALGCNVDFAGWKNPFRNWKEWVARMKPLHESTWRDAGIQDAIITSTYKIRMDTDVILGLAQRWCSDTNTFIFPWGEATISLEDAMILGGFYVVGHSVLSPIETQAEEEFIQIDGELNKVREEMNKKKARRASQHTWMNYLMGIGSDIEHVAFLVLWLSRHVFPCTRDVVGKHFHKMAFRLARGTRLALAPVVLAFIYQDLRLWRGNVSNERVIEQEEIKLWSLMQLVQIWVWERFPTLGPQPNFIGEGEPRMARWNNVKRLNPKSVRLAIDADGENFVWRPYTDWEKFKFYPQNEIWVPVCPGMLEDFVSFAKFERVSELVGLNCVEPYFPHRVSRQFGLDQDIPGEVARFKESPEIAWKFYARPIGDEKLYIPSRLFASAVTSRYSEWWKGSKLIWENVVNGNDSKLLLATTSPQLKKFKAIVEDNATPMSKEVTAGGNVMKLEGDTKASESENKMGSDKQVREKIGGKEILEDHRFSRHAKPKIPEYPPGFEPI